MNWKQNKSIAIDIIYYFVINFQFLCYLKYQKMFAKLEKFILEKETVNFI